VQVSPDRYYEVALGILATDGVTGLKIGKMCGTLNVTSGSFYHHFGGWSGFVAGLLEYWEAEQTRRLLLLTQARPDPWERVQVLKELATTVPHEAEAAIRAWGRSDPLVGAVQRQVDDLRKDGLRQVILDVGVKPDDADLLASMGMALLAGHQQLSSPVGVRELRALLDEFEQIVIDHVNPAPPP
jgi:AcrR family transcriptional regulator